jgi:hypothetical protein
MIPIYVYLIFIHLLALLWGIHRAAEAQSGPADLLLSLTVAITIVLACANDARIRRTPLVSIIKFIMLFTWPITAPVYLIWSRGWRGVLWAILWSITFYGIYIIPAVYVFAHRAPS